MKRLAAFILVLILGFTMLTPSAFAASGARDTSFEEKLAVDLQGLGLLKSVTGNDFALDRAPTRIEAVVMLVRSLGKESEALASSWTDPFTDVPEWASKYVSYAFRKGYVNGVSYDKFGTGKASAEMYVTFALRSLGYFDQRGDFYWKQPFSLARSAGILPNRVSLTDFRRADAVMVTYLSLSAKMNNSGSTLADKLISDGTITAGQYETCYDKDAAKKAERDLELTPVEIYARCSPAVFYLEVFDSRGSVSGNASGFFIDSNGTAVVNFHSIKKAYSAKITTSDTNKVYDVVGVYDYNADQDWAIIKVNGTGFSYLDQGDSSTLAGGETTYAIGSPLGLKNTISKGIVSTPKRQLTPDGITFVQTTAEISSGSGGGALLNSYGEVIGITAATVTAGQNLNLAVPINLIKGYSTSSCRTLLAININPASALTAYADYPEVPDCGAFYGINVMISYPTSVGTTYYYNSSMLNSPNDWVKTDKYAYPKYLDELTEWGFTNIGEFKTGSSYYWEFTFSSKNANYIVNVGTGSLGGVACLSVQITKS